MVTSGHTQRKCRLQCCHASYETSDNKLKLSGHPCSAASATHLSHLAAGYTWDGVIHKMPLKQWTAMLDVHLTAPFRLIQAAAPHLRDAAKAEIERDGKAAPRSIINVSSTSGTHGNAGQVNYGTVCICFL